MELIAPIKKGFCQMRGTIYVGTRVATEAEMVAQVVKRN
jgi:UDP-3-O-[3-hydroxymyristoyl] N-acetylglucosamine deacetylase / 3-hydroxyacyl-[acyl-carrier-protein] dehydratase